MTGSRSDEFISQVWDRARWQKSVQHLVAKVTRAETDGQLLDYARQLRMVGRFKDGEWEVKVG